MLYTPAQSSPLVVPGDQMLSEQKFKNRDDGVNDKE